MLLSVGHLATRPCHSLVLSAALPLLDQLPGAFLALSTRKLRENYTGAALSLRRDSDDLLADIGFDAVGNLDTAAVAAHLNGANGYVATWFDQSGTGHDFGVAAASQPQLVLNGLNGKPALSFNGSNQYFDDLYNITHAPGDWTMVAAMESVTSGGTDHIFTTRWYSPANSISFLSLTNISRYGFEVDNIMYHSPGGAVAGPHCYGIVLESPDKAQIRLDGTVLAENLTYSPHGMYANSRIGRAVGSVYYFQGLLSELIIWPRALPENDLSTLESSQTDYFIGA